MPRASRKYTPNASGPNTGGSQPTGRRKRSKDIRLANGKVVKYDPTIGQKLFSKFESKIPEGTQGKGVVAKAGGAPTAGETADPGFYRGNRPTGNQGSLTQSTRSGGNQAAQDRIRDRETSQGVGYFNATHRHGEQIPGLGRDFVQGRNRPTSGQGSPTDTTRVQPAATGSRGNNSGLSTLVNAAMPTRPKKAFKGSRGRR